MTSRRHDSAMIIDRRKFITNDPSLGCLVSVFRRPFLKRFALSYRTIVCPVCLSCPVCNVGVLWPNAWTDQDDTCHAGRPLLWPHCVSL